MELSVCHGPCDIIIKYCEVIIRVLANFFYSALDDFKYDYSIDIFTKKFGKKKEYFQDCTSHFTQDVFKGMTLLIQSHQFEIIYYLARYIMIVDDKYIEYCTTMNIKSFLYNLEKVLRGKYLHNNFEFFCSRRKQYLPMGLDKSLLSYNEHEKIVKDIEDFWQSRKNDSFEFVKPTLVRTVKWKFDGSLFLEKLVIPFKRYRDDAIAPLKAYSSFAGYDLYANEFKILKAGGEC